MKNFILALLFLTIVFPIKNFACSCFPPDSFCSSISYFDGTIAASVIVRGKLSRSHFDEKYIKVNHLIYGELSQKEIILNIDLCTLYFDELEENSEYIFALILREGDYYPITCAISYLKVENEVVKGKIAPGINFMNYEDLADLNQCANVFDFVSMEKSVSLFPNPTSGILNIKNNSPDFPINFLEVQVFDITGKEISFLSYEEELPPQELMEFNMSSFSAGVYIVKVANAYTEHSFKVVKR